MLHSQNLRAILIQRFTKRIQDCVDKGITFGEVKQGGDGYAFFDVIRNGQVIDSIVQQTKNPVHWILLLDDQIVDPVEHAVVEALINELNGPGELQDVA